MKVIFLDIDGVMNSVDFFTRNHKKRWFKLKTYWYLIKPSKIINLKNYKPSKSIYTFKRQFKQLKVDTCPVKWKWLSEFCNKRDIKICVSSVWRNQFRSEISRKDYLWETALQKLGFKENTFVGVTGQKRELRGTEIKEWLEKNPSVEDYAILDDDSDMLPEQMNKFYKCDSYYGLSPNHLYKIGLQFSKSTLDNSGINKVIDKIKREIEHN